MSSSYLLLNIPATPASFQFFRGAKLFPASGPLHVLFSRPTTLFPQLCRTGLSPSSLSQMSPLGKGFLNWTVIFISHFILLFYFLHHTCHSVTVFPCLSVSPPRPGVEHKLLEHRGLVHSCVPQVYTAWHAVLEERTKGTLPLCPGLQRGGVAGAAECRAVPCCGPAATWEWPAHQRLPNSWPQTRPLQCRGWEGQTGPASWTSQREAATVS